MSDLISRKALAEAIRQAAPKYVPLWVYETIKEQPTAYDPDKVVEQLIKGSEKYEDYTETLVYVLDLDKAIEIVKKGGAV